MGEEAILKDYLLAHVRHAKHRDKSLDLTARALINALNGVWLKVPMRQNLFEFCELQGWRRNLTIYRTTSWGFRRECIKKIMQVYQLNCITQSILYGVCYLNLLYPFLFICFQPNRGKKVKVPISILPTMKA